MNLSQWDVDAGTNCHNAGSSDRRDWIVNGYPDIRTLNGNPPGTEPTYVCNDTGHSTSNWSTLHDEIGKTKLFPVNDCDGQLDKSGNACRARPRPTSTTSSGSPSCWSPRSTRATTPRPSDRPERRAAARPRSVHSPRPDVEPLSSYGTGGGCRPSLRIRGGGRGDRAEEGPSVHAVLARRPLCWLRVLVRRDGTNDHVANRRGDQPQDYVRLVDERNSGGVRIDPSPPGSVW